MPGGSSDNGNDNKVVARRQAFSHTPMPEGCVKRRDYNYGTFDQLEGSVRLGKHIYNKFSSGSDDRREPYFGRPIPRRGSLDPVERPVVGTNAIISIVGSTCLRTSRSFMARVLEICSCAHWDHIGASEKVRAVPLLTVNPSPFPPCRNLLQASTFYTNFATFGPV